MAKSLTILSKVRFEVLLLAVIIVNIANPSGIQNA